MINKKETETRARGKEEPDFREDESRSSPWRNSLTAPRPTSSYSFLNQKFKKDFKY